MLARLALGLQITTIARTVATALPDAFAVEQSVLRQPPAEAAAPLDGVQHHAEASVLVPKLRLLAERSPPATPHVHLQPLHASSLSLCHAVSVQTCTCFSSRTNHS